MDNSTNIRKSCLYVRFLWHREVDLEKISEDFAEYEPTLREELEDPNRRPFHGYNLRELKVKADTLGAFLSVKRAVLFQREKKPFTKRDVELRKKIFEIYTKDRQTPLPMLLIDEPKFEVENNKEINV
jgi:hypothetical protein